MAFTFTRNAYIDKRNEDVSIVLENALVQGRFWLPRRQEVEVRRTGTWLDFPARGIIRGRWDIAEYAVNAGVPADIFRGPPLEFLPARERRAYAFGGRMLDSLPADVRLVTDADVRRVQAQARALVEADVLRRARGRALSARGVSDFARVNRVEGLALGAGYVARFGGGASLGLQGRYGLSDETAKGRAVLEWRRVTGAAIGAEGYRSYREAGDEPETSTVRNSIAAQEFGSDWTDPFDAVGGGLFAELPAGEVQRLTVRVGYETQDALRVRARPFAGTFERTIPARALTALRAEVGVERPTSAGPLGSEVRWECARAPRRGAAAPAAGSPAMRRAPAARRCAATPCCTSSVPSAPPPATGGSSCTRRSAAWAAARGGCRSATTPCRRRSSSTSAGRSRPPATPSTRSPGGSPPGSASSGGRRCPFPRSRSAATAPRRRAPRSRPTRTWPTSPAGRLPDGARWLASVARRRRLRVLRPAAARRRARPARRALAVLGGRDARLLARALTGGRTRRRAG
jgi:hypothetical protein